MSNGTPQRLTRLLVCEGPEDHFFFQRLIEVNALPRFCILHAYGRGRFRQTINAFRVERTTDYNAIRDMLIVADNDEDPPGRFKDVCTQIDRLYGANTAPTAPLQKVPRGAARPSITVLMMPWTDVKGHLEQVCVELARSTDSNIGARVDTFMALIHANRWTNTLGEPNESRFTKAWLRTNLAARCEKDPFAPLGYVFTESRYQPLIPVRHPSLSNIIGVLNGFAP